MDDRIDQNSKAEFDNRIAGMVKTHKVQCIRAALATRE